MSGAGQCPTGELLIYLGMLAGEAKLGQFFDVRWSTPAGGMNRRFVSALRAQDAVRLITRLASRTDVYVGVVLREGRTYGGKAAIGGSHLLYIECDEPDAAERLGGFAYAPSMIVASGSPGHLHIYWCLQGRASTAQVESANRRLALALRGDPACVDIARVLRPPSTLNHKHRPPLAVRLLEHHTDARYELHELTYDLTSACWRTPPRTGPARFSAPSTKTPIRAFSSTPMAPSTATAVTTSTVRAVRAGRSSTSPPPDGAWAPAAGTSSSSAGASRQCSRSTQRRSVALDVRPFASMALGSLPGLWCGCVDRHAGPAQCRVLT